MRDIDNGVITRDRAMELLEAFLIKTNELNKLRSWPDTSMFTGYHMAINLAVGGQTADGNDAVNDLSHLCVEACSDLKLFTPSISLKVFEGTDPEFIDKALIAVQDHKGGQPGFLQMTESFIEIPKEYGRCRRRSLQLGSGRLHRGSLANGILLRRDSLAQLLKVLEMTFNGGRIRKREYEFSKAKADLYSFKSASEIFEAFMLA